MNIPQMAAQAREHWKVTNPEIYRQMVEDKALVECSEAAAKLTMREMKTLMLGGLTEQEAWQESRHLFIFRTAEQMEKSYQPERDENGKVMQPSWCQNNNPTPVSETQKVPKELNSIQEQMSLCLEGEKTNNHYPKVNRGHFLSDPHEDISWAEGTLHDGRPFRIEYWYRSDSSFITVYISSLDIENASEQELKDLLIKEGLIDFDDEKYLNSGFGGGINLTAKKFKDASDNEMWSLTIILGDDDGTYIRTNVEFKKYIFPDKKTDPYIYTHKATNVENAEYFITLCEEQSKQGTSSMYYGYFINNTSVPIEIMFDLPPGALSKIESGSTVDSLVNNPPNNKWITQYTNIPAHSYVGLNMLYFEWEFDFSNARHIFLKTAGVEKHINFYMEKYFIRREEIDCIPVLNRRGYVCLPSLYKKDN